MNWAAARTQQVDRSDGQSILNENECKENKTGKESDDAGRLRRRNPEGLYGAPQGNGRRLRASPS